MLALFIGSIFISGCATLTDLRTVQDQSRDTVLVLEPGQTAGQTFQAHQSGIKSLAIWLAPVEDEEVQPSVTASLLYSPQDDHPIATEVFTVVSSGPYYLKFSPRDDPPGQAYYLRLTSGGPVRLLGSLVDIYPNGQASLDGQPQAGDLAFRVTYEFTLSSLIQDLTGSIPSWWLALPLGILLLAPGWLVLDLVLGKLISHPASPLHLDGGQTVAVSVGLSLGLIPLLMLWTSILGLHWRLPFVLALFGLLLGAALWRVWLRLPSVKIGWIGAALGLVFLFSLVLRFEMARDLAAPSWVDSVHHALITRLILLEGGFPQTYAPYLDLPATQYHAGYHSGLAAFIWLSGLDLSKAMLIYGQVLNALAVFPAYLLGTLLTKDRRIGLLAALAAGVFSPMPAYYTSWGRYTQLAGLLVLPALLPFAWHLLECVEEWNITRSLRKLWRPALLFSLAAAGLFLVHYRVAAFAIALVLAEMLTRLFWKETDWRRLLRGGLWLAGSGLLAAVLILPWLLPDLRLLLRPSTSPSSGSTIKLFSDFAWTLLTSASGMYLLALAALGFVLGLLFHRRFAFTLGLWMVFLFILANLGALGLPGGWFINNTSVEILLFLPLGVLAGYFLVEELSALGRILPLKMRRYAGAALAGVLVIASFWGGKNLLPLLNPDTSQARSGDLPALAWIDTHLPGDATVLINPFLWGYNLYAGNDGGFWISPLTGRRTMPPPVLYGFGEREAIQQINDFCLQVMKQGGDPVTLRELMMEQGIHYVYTGVRGGPISPTALLSSPQFQVLYASQGAYVFEVEY